MFLGILEHQNARKYSNFKSARKVHNFAAIYEMMTNSMDSISWDCNQFRWGK